MIWLFVWGSGQTVNLIPKVFPDEPTEYIEIEQVRSSKTWTAPEDGWFQFIGLAASGKGGIDAYGQYGTQHFGGGGGGGAGGITVSIFALSQGDEITLSVGLGVSITNKKTGETASADSGRSGSDGYESSISSQNYYGGSGGAGGSASGGNVTNKKGPKGGDGGSTSDTSVTPASSLRGRGGRNAYEKYYTQGGSGGNYSGSSAYIVVLRGNTNLTQAQLNSYDISTLMLNNTQLEQEVTGILLSQSAQ